MGSPSVRSPPAVQGSPPRQRPPGFKMSYGCGFDIPVCPLNIRLPLSPCDPPAPLPVSGSSVPDSGGFGPPLDSRLPTSQPSPLGAHMEGTPDRLSYPVSGSSHIAASHVPQSVPCWQTRIRMAHRLEIQSSATESR